MSGALGAIAATVASASAALADTGMATDGQIHLQEPATPIMESITAFHNNLLLWIITAIVLLVLALLVIVMLRFNSRANPTPSKTSHNSVIEVVWTVVPILILVVIAVPSFGVLADQQTIPDGNRKYLGSNIFSYGEVELPAPAVTVKATGVQWSWSYEYPDLGISFDSFMLPETSTNGFDRPTLKPNEPRLLAVDNDIVVPVNTTVRVLVTADPTGVIHSFAVPSFGIKVDAVPGRTNETWFYAEREGIYYGQCSELCGKDHAFMPIAVRVVSQDQYDAWAKAVQDGDIDAGNALLGPVT
ncbi:MAG: cytochrome c oxidase subunit II [Hyphomicrobiaceae bacterium]|nr:cytochrome c oxidase subunit II [Hyphomicrobiaceae bacterium]MCC0023023.1 cytochrome c oxidase subunit II [Hyphomicrobiaceae bacterium]